MSNFAVFIYYYLFFFAFYCVRGGANGDRGITKSIPFPVTRAKGSSVLISSVRRRLGEENICGLSDCRYLALGQCRSKRSRRSRSRS